MFVFKSFMLEYKSSVLFCSPQGTSILQVSAVDGDRGVANQVTYSFDSGKTKTQSMAVTSPHGW